jgi:hypothetical protein
VRSLAAEGLDLLAEDCRDASSWRRRIERDRNRVRAMQRDGMWQVTTTLTSRCVQAGAIALALTGSTARDRRTHASDVDLHVVGPRPAVVDFPVEVDICATTVAQLFQRLRAGDDYVQWTLRFGCVLLDSGVLRAAAQELTASATWPSPERKLDQVRRILPLAEQVVASGDVEAGAEEVRRAVTAVARWRLLSAGAFPLSRAELPVQLRAVGEQDVAAALERCLHGPLEADELRALVAFVGDAVTSAAPARTA